MTLNADATFGAKRRRFMAYAIDYSEYIEINGDRQNIRVRAAREGLPVFLFLHGGPGVCDRHLVLANHSGLAEKYTLVCWDQRGSGKSYSRSSAEAPLRLNDFVDDAEFLLEYLAGKFGVRKIIVEGHSWGTAIGTLLAARRPDLVAVYIGQGQLVNGAENERVSYEFCLNEAARTGDKKALEMLTGGAPVNGEYPTRKAMMVQRDCLPRYGGANYRERKGLVKSLLLPLLRTKEYSLGDVAKYTRGALALTDKLWKDVVSLRFDEEIKKLEMPVVITQGRHDFNTPSSIAEKWFGQLDAPFKKWIWFEDSAHSPADEEVEKWETEVERALDEIAEKFPLR